MTSFDKIRRVLVKYFIDLRWQSIFVAIAIYFAASWLLLALCGETDITSGSNFLYWIMVTASTVGYGDFSPTTAAGKLVTALFVIPLGLKYLRSCDWPYRYICLTPLAQRSIRFENP